MERAKGYCFMKLRINKQKWKSFYQLITDEGEEERGEEMIGGVIFVIVFVLFLVISLFINLPPGFWVLQELIPDIQGTDYEFLVNGIINGVTYGLIIWVIFSVAKMVYDRSRGPKEVAIKVEHAPGAPKIEKKKEISEIHVRSVRIQEIEGIGPTYKKKLKEEGIGTTKDLLEAGSTRQGRRELAEKTGISEKLILEWVNLADLFRIKGVGEEYSDLLEEAGVDTVVELSRRNPENLHAKIVEINDEKKLVRRTPTRNQVKEWVEQAKTMPRKVEH